MTSFLNCSTKFGGSSKKRVPKSSKVHKTISIKQLQNISANQANLLTFVISATLKWAETLSKSVDLVKKYRHQERRHQIVPARVRNRYLPSMRSVYLTYSQNIFFAAFFGNFRIEKCFLLIKKKSWTWFGIMFDPKTI